MNLIRRLIAWRWWCPVKRFAKTNMNTNLSVWTYKCRFNAFDNIRWRRQQFSWHVTCVNASNFHTTHINVHLCVRQRKFCLRPKKMSPISAFSSKFVRILIIFRTVLNVTFIESIGSITRMRIFIRTQSIMQLVP